jgi:hypothetical protein
LLPNNCRYKKHYVSSTAGFIHIIHIVDYLGICQTLVTPAEVREYLNFREQLINRWGDKVSGLPEQSLVGQFLFGDISIEPNFEHIEYLSALNNNPAEWDFSNIISKFADRVQTITNPDDYYHVIAEIAKLNRNELREFKRRFELSVEKSRANEFTLPYRIVVPRTGCGFVFIPLTQDLVEQKLRD